MKEENIQDELRDLSPLLSGLKSKKDPKKAPDGYFDSLEAKVFQRLEAEGARVSVPEAPTGWKVWLKPRYLMAVAAAMALLVAAVWFLRPQDVPTPALADTTVEEITPEMAEAYVQDNILDFEAEELLAAELDDLDLETLSAPTPNAEQPKHKPAKQKIEEDDLDAILNDLTEEELEDIL